MHQYEGRQDFIEFHSGFGLYMLRPRKDTGMNKIQEIALKVNAIGQELAPDGNYELSITGHSLGGALATVLGKTLYLCASLWCYLLDHNLHVISLQAFIWQRQKMFTPSRFASSRKYTCVWVSFLAAVTRRLIQIPNSESHP